MYKCDYCEGPLAALYKISTNGTPTFTLFEPDFCPKCGTSLREVKPLTVEQLKQMDGKPVYVVGNGEKEWCIMNVNPNNSDSFNGAYIAGNECSWYELSLYLKTWFAYTQQPKGEAE